MNVWQPLHTAPMDGTRVLAHGVGDEYPYIAWYDDEELHEWVTDAESVVYPECWMPLPKVDMKGSQNE